MFAYSLHRNVHESYTANLTFFTYDFYRVSTCNLTIRDRKEKLIRLLYLSLHKPLSIHNLKL